MVDYMTKKKKTNQSGHGLGGHRDGSGRKPKEDKDDYVQVTVVLRRDTVEKLRAGTGSKANRPQFGQFLQFHLDRHPLPTYEEYRYLRELKPFTVRFKGRKIPAIVTVPTPDKPGQKHPRRPVDEAFAQALAKARKKRVK